MGSGETDTAHIEEPSENQPQPAQPQAQLDTISASTSHAFLPDLASLSTAFRGDRNPVHLSQSFLAPSIVSPSEFESHAQSHVTRSQYERNASYLASWVSNSRMLGENTGGTTHPLAGSLIIVNAALGSAYLNFPAAFHEAGGIIVGNIVQLVLLCFIFPSLLTLAYCADWNGSKTLQEVLASVWGQKVERACAICIVIYCFGICITFLIIVGDQLDRAFASIAGEYFCHTWYMNRSFTTVAASIVFVLPFCYPKKIDFLKYISSIGVFSIFYFAALIVYKFFYGNYTPGEIRWSTQSFGDFFLVVPTLCFGYQCHVSVIPIYSCYKIRNPRTFAWSSGIAFFICAIIYTIAGSFAYLTFGSNSASDILLSYDASDPAVIVAIIAIAIKTFSTYPLMCFCGNSAVCDLIFSANQQVDERTRERVRLLSVSIWFAVTLTLATLIPTIGSVIKLLGSMAAIFIFMFPGICMLKIAEKPDGRVELGEPNKIILTVAGFFLAVGGFLFGVVTSNAMIYNFIKPHEEPPPLCLPLP